MIADESYLLVNVPYVSLHREPAEEPEYDIWGNDLGVLSQCLLGEMLVPLEEVDGWFYVEAIEQPQVDSGYYGWVKKDVVVSFEDDSFGKSLLVRSLQAELVLDDSSVIVSSMGSRVIGIENADDVWKVVLPDGRHATVAIEDVVIENKMRLSRRRVVEIAKTFLDMPYYWGGRGVVDTGIDCSGLVDMSYRLNGVMVPRDSGDQFICATKLSAQLLRPGDIVFLSEKERKNKICHVLLYAGHDMLIEALGGDIRKTRCISFKDRFGVNCKSMKYGQEIQDKHIFFATFFNINAT